MFDDDARTLHIKKTIKRDEVNKQKGEEHENRTKLDKVLLKEEFLAAFNKTRTTDKRVPLILCTKQ